MVGLKCCCGAHVDQKEGGGAEVTPYGIIDV